MRVHRRQRERERETERERERAKGGRDRRGQREGARARPITNLTAICYGYYPRNASKQAASDQERTQSPCVDQS